MPEITLTDEQARALSEAKDTVVLQDKGGTVRLVVDPHDAIVLARHHLRQQSGKKEPSLSGQKVGEFLNAIQAELTRAGKVDPARAKEILAQIRSESAP